MTMRPLMFLVMATAAVAADEPVVDRHNIMTDTVRRGDLVRKVDGYGKARRVGAEIEAVIEIPGEKAQDVRVGQPVLIDVREGLLRGGVSSIGAVHGQTRSVVIKVNAAQLPADSLVLHVSEQRPHTRCIECLAGVGSQNPINMAHRTFAET